MWNTLFSIGTTDFEALNTTVTVTSWRRWYIRLFTTNDDITLEYDDSVLLTFTPYSNGIIQELENTGEYVRDTATVNIIDNDSK